MINDAGGASEWVHARLTPIVTCLMLLAGSEIARATPAVTALRLSPCDLSGSAGEARCGRFVVPEDRAAPLRHSLDLKVIVLDATGDRTSRAEGFPAIRGMAGEAVRDTCGRTRCGGPCICSQGANGRYEKGGPGALALAQRSNPSV